MDFSSLNNLLQLGYSLKEHELHKKKLYPKRLFSLLKTSLRSSVFKVLIN